MTTRPALDREALFVVSGGARGVTANCVLELARRYGCRFLLLGRSEQVEEPAWARGIDDATELMRLAAHDLRARAEKATPSAIQRLCNRLAASREIARTLAAIHDVGGRAEYLATDVVDGPALTAALVPTLARLGRPVGLIHGAGALSDRLIGRKSARDFDLVYGTKVRGLANLLDCLPIADLDYIVLFTSAAGFFGNPGQSDYAMANEVLNRVAHLAAHRAPRCRVLSLNWGPWDGGMVTPALKRLFAERGVEMIPIDEGARTLADVLVDEREPNQVVVGGGFAPVPTLATGRSRSHRIWRTLTLESNPVLRDHVVGGKAVLPAVCAIHWLSSVSEALHPGFRAIAIESFKVLKGIVFDADQAGAYALDVTEAEADDERLVLECRISSQPDGARIRNHYGANVTLVRERSRAPEYHPLDTREDSHARGGDTLYGDGTLFHGAAFRGIRRLINANPEWLTVECSSPAISRMAQGHFPADSFNPFAADTLLQSQLVWARLFRGVASLPLSCQRVEILRPLPFDEPFFVTVEVRSVSDHAMVADLVATTRDGLVLTRIAGSDVTLSGQLNRLFVTASPA